MNDDKKVFELLMKKYGVYDYTKWIGDSPRFDIDAGMYRIRCYHDSGWFEDYDMEPVIYWGA
jgi:hypothetical protein